MSSTLKEAYKLNDLTVNKKYVGIKKLCEVLVHKHNQTLKRWIHHYSNGTSELFQESLCN